MRRCHVAAAAVLLALAAAHPARAQVAAGRIEITIVDATAAVLQGVMVELDGPLHETAVTGNNGLARFLNLPPGVYSVKASLPGFADAVSPAVPVAAGGHVELRTTMVVGGVRQQVDVRPDAPVTDARNTSTNTSITLDELQNIPTARDPWVVLQSVPGVIVDRVDVGGSESGQQSSYLAKGAGPADSAWTLEGIPITDMFATGATPTYFDFDTFQEVHVSTGGADLANMTGGVTLNVILKAGSSTPRGSGRVYVEDGALQGTNISSDLATALGSPNGKGKRTSRYLDSGFEFGTPIVKDRLWAWGSFARTDVTLLTIQQASDETNLTNGALKVQGRPRRGVRAVFTHFYGNKVKHGRDAGATRPPETTYDQKGPSRFYKGAVDAVFGDSLYLSARGSHFSTGFSLDPRGGMNTDVYYDDSGVWHGSYPNYSSDRPQQTFIGEGSCFRGRHELKFGYSWRRATAETTSAAPSSTGSGIITYHVGYPDLWVRVESPSASSARAVYQSAWIGDTVSLSRATVTAGVRYDGQSDGVLPISVPAVKGFEAWLPALSGPAIPKAIVWHSLSPRIGITYGLDEARRTQLRASYARFASQLANGASSIAGVGQSRYVAFYGLDASGDKIAQYGEIDFAGGPVAWGGFSLDRPSSRTSVNEIGGYNVPQMHELVVGVDHELVNGIGVRASLTWRRMSGFNWTPRIGVREPLYRLASTLKAGPLPDGSNASTPVYAITADRVPAAAPGRGDGVHRARRIPPAVLGLRGERREAPVEPVDGPPRRLDERPPRVLRQPRDIHRGPDAGPGQPERGRRPRHRDGRRLGTERRVFAPAEVPGHRQRPLPGTVGHRRRREPDHPPGVRPAVVSLQRVRSGRLLQPPEERRVVR